MEILHACCAGLDVHKETVVACLRRLVEGKVRQDVRTFRTETNQLLALADWLAQEGVTHVAMESTGVYWMPVFHALAESDALEVVLCNAQHVKNVPGRKTDLSKTPSGWPN